MILVWTLHVCDPTRPRGKKWTLTFSTFAILCHEDDIHLHISAADSIHRHACMCSRSSREGRDVGWEHTATTRK
jgi:hypothetical protein